MSVHLTSCWTPFFWHNNVRDGALAVAVYSIFLCVFVLTYTVYVMCGGDSSQLWLPFFETNLNNSLTAWGTIVLVYFVLLLVCSFMLAVGVRRDVRGLMIPWMVGMAIVVLFQAGFGLWMIFGYYIYLEVVFVALCCWLWMGINAYAWLAVRSHYRNVKMYQSPEIEYVGTY